MNEPKNISNVPVRATQGPAAKAQKVRSSRYEWESKSNNENEKEKAAGVSGTSRRSLLASAREMLRRLFSGTRGTENRSYFDNDDDASPSAA